MLNFWIAVLLITSSTNGYDGSMMSEYSFPFTDPEWIYLFTSQMVCNPSTNGTGTLTLPPVGRYFRSHRFFSNQT